jgi:hypothetical protein
VRGRPRVNDLLELLVLGLVRREELVAGKYGLGQQIDEIRTASIIDRVASAVPVTCAATPYACSPRKKTLLPSGKSSERGGAARSVKRESSEAISDKIICTACSTSLSWSSKSFTKDPSSRRFRPVRYSARSSLDVTGTYLGGVGREAALPHLQSAHPTVSSTSAGSGPPSSSTAPVPSANVGSA